MTTYSRSSQYAYITCTPTGDDTNGAVWGGQQSGNGVDYSLDDDAHVVIDGTTITAEIANRTTLELTAGWTVSNDDVGNGVRIYAPSTGGHWITGPITSVHTGDNTWTIPSQHGPWNGISAGLAVTGAMGGACATPGEAASRVPTNGGVYVKAGTYTLTSNSSDVSGGRPALPTGCFMSAFKTVVGDHLANPDDRVILLRGSTTDNGAMVDDAGSYMEMLTGFDLRCDSVWAQGTDVGMAINCIVRNATSVGFNTSKAFSCAAYDCGTGSDGYGFDGGDHFECAAYDCASGFYTDSAVRCLAHDCTVLGFYGTNSGGYSFCVADDCPTGFSQHARGFSGWNMATNCTNGGTGGAMPGLAAAFNNVSNWEDMTEITGGLSTQLQLTADPYEDRTGTPPDFRINDTAGGGAELANFAPKWGASGISGPQEQFAAIVKSSGSSGSTVFPSFPINAGT